MEVEIQIGIGELSGVMPRFEFVSNTPEGCFRRSVKHFNPDCISKSVKHDGSRRIMILGPCLAIALSEV